MHPLLTAAEELGAELVRRNIGLVYGGGNVGLMGVLGRGGECLSLEDCLKPAEPAASLFAQVE
jgi:hypothetical protein